MRLSTAYFALASSDVIGVHLQQQVSATTGSATSTVFLFPPHAKRRIDKAVADIMVLFMPIG
jgi:hypothetical protein